MVSKNVGTTPGLRMLQTQSSIEGNQSWNRECGNSEHAYFINASTGVIKLRTLDKCTYSKDLKRVRATL